MNIIPQSSGMLKIEEFQPNYSISGNMLKCRFFWVNEHVTEQHIRSLTNLPDEFTSLATLSGDPYGTPRPAWAAANIVTIEADLEAVLALKKE